jgi:hypothetical protein
MQVDEKDDFFPDRMRMYEEFEGCDHLVEELYDYARKHRLGEESVEHEVMQAYHQQKDAYDALLEKGGRGYEEKLRALNVRVFTNARNGLVDRVTGKRFP